MSISLAEAAEKRWGTSRPVELPEEERQRIRQECEELKEKVLEVSRERQATAEQRGRLILVKI